MDGQRLFGRKGDLHFAVALFAVATGQPARWQQNLWLGDRPIPLDRQQRLRIDFTGPPGAFPVVPFREALAVAQARQPAPVDVHGAIVLIGVTSKSHQDYHAKPYGNRFYLRMFNEDAGLMAGSEIHAHIIATLADQSYLRTPPWPVNLALLLMVGAVLGQLFLHTNLEGGPAVALVHHFG